MLIKINNSWVESSIVDAVAAGEGSNAGKYLIYMDGYDAPASVGCTQDEIDAFASRVNDAENVVDLAELVDAAERLLGDEECDECGRRDEEFCPECDPCVDGCPEDVDCTAFGCGGVASSFPRLTGVDVPLDCCGRRETGDES